MIEKSLFKVLIFRKEVLDIQDLEERYKIKLPPIFRAFITVFEPYFSYEKYHKTESSKYIPFTNLIYSHLELDNYTAENDSFGLESFKEVEEMFTFEPSNKGFLKDLLFIANHGYSGGLMVGIGAHNKDMIFHNSNSKIITFIAGNIFELIHKMIIVQDEIDDPWIDTSKLYKNWGEDFWRIREEDNT